MGVRIASPNPPACSACYCAKPEKRHVDFDATTDGAVLVGDLGVTGSIEDIIVCEDCVRAGAEELAMEPTRMEALAQELRAAREDAALWRGRAEALAAAAGEWDVRTNWDAEPQPQEPEVLEPQDDEKRPIGFSYPKELREEAVKRVAGGLSAYRVAKDLGVSQPTVKKWVREHEQVA